MARNRMIKPEFWSDEKTGMLLTSDEKCLFIGMWNFADDEGLINGNPIYLKSSIFPYTNNIDPEQIENILKKLSELEMIFRYTRNNQSYLWVIKFKVHQRIDKPGKPQNPPPSIQNNSYKKAIHHRDNYLCYMCGEYTDVMDKINKCKSKFPSIDHIKPKSKGGSDYPSNLKTACLSCNKSKQDKIVPRVFQECSQNGIDEGKGREGKGKEVKGKGKEENPLFFKIKIEHQKQINVLCTKLQPKIFPEIIHFRNEMLNKGINPRTIIHAFEKAFKKQTFDDTRGGVKAYCQKIIIIEDGNYNEKEGIEKHNEKKSDTEIHTEIKSVIGEIGIRL